MRLPDTAHTSLAWRIHELTRDSRLVRQIAAGHTSTNPSRMETACDRLELAAQHVRGVTVRAQAFGALTSAMAVSSRSASSGRQITRSGR